MTLSQLARTFIFLLTVSRMTAADVPFDRFYPTAATLVTVAERAQLQSKLDAHGVIRLEAADYTAVMHLPE